MMVINTAGLSRSQRLCLGMFVLLAVVIIWSASAELTEYIFKEEKYRKPFFTTYVKNSLFVVYLAGFIFNTRWQRQCFSSYLTTSTHHHPHENKAVNDQHDANLQYSDTEAFMSEPKYQPLNYNSDSEKSSVSGGDESDLQLCRSPSNSIVNGDASDCGVVSSINRSVRFNRVAEVRQLPVSEAAEASVARMSYLASLRAQLEAAHLANRLPVRYVAKIAFIFCFLWFGGQLSYQEALSDTHSAIVQVLSSSSSLFTLILSAIFPSNQYDKLTLSKLFTVLLSCGGVVLVTIADEGIEHLSVPQGALWALSGALLYAMYLVFLKRKAGDESRLDIPMFFGFVGLYNLICLWPGFFILHKSDVERFDWPNSHQLTYLVINAVVGTVIAELLWLWGCFLTSSLIATLSLTLTIPITMFADLLLRHVHYGWMFYVSSIPIILSFFLCALLLHWDNWDPCLALLKYFIYTISKLSRCCSYRGLREDSSIDREQRESLISECQTKNDPMSHVA